MHTFHEVDWKIPPNAKRNQYKTLCYTRMHASIKIYKFVYMYLYSTIYMYMLIELLAVHIYAIPILVLAISSFLKNLISKTFCQIQIKLLKK